MAKKKYYDKNQDENANQEEMEEQEGGTSNIKIETVLLAIIALALVIQTFYMISGSGKSDTPEYIPANNSNQPAAMTQPQSQPQLQQMQQQPQAQPQQPQIQTQPQVQTQPQQPQQAPPQQNANATTASYSENSFDFGTVSQSASGLTHTFTVTNAGNKPLTYTKVYGDPGVQVTSYPTQPIPAGGQGKVTVQFDPAQAKGGGNQAYNVHLEGNTNPAHQHLVLQATVQ